MFLILDANFVMVDLKNRNLMVRDSGGEHTIARIFDLLDLMGKNFIYMHNKTSPLSGYLKCRKILFTKDSFDDDFNNNLFRLDFVIIESDPTIYYSKVKNITKVPIVFICNVNSKDYKEGRLKISEFDCAYRTWEAKRSARSGIGTLQWPMPKINMADYCVEDLKNLWTSNLKELKVQYIRDRNLKDLFGESFGDD